MSLQSYQATQRSTESPRSTEYRLFAQVTRAMMECKDLGPSKLFDALEWNRRVWLTLQSDLAHPGNRLPDKLKAQLISLSLWVDRHTSKVVQGKAKIQALIDVNRSIMEGLAANIASNAAVPVRSMSNRTAA